MTSTTWNENSEGGWGGGLKQKCPPSGGGDGYFLELHNEKNTIEGSKSCSRLSDMAQMSAFQCTLWVFLNHSTGEQRVSDTYSQHSFGQSTQKSPDAKTH